MKNILIIKGNPKEKSFGNELVDRYIQGAKKAGHGVECMRIADLQLSQYLYEGFDGKVELSDELVAVQEKIVKADHLVFAYPLWWGTSPAIMKLFIEVVFQSGFAFKYHPPKGKKVSWDKLLENKSARLLVTMDSPTWYYTWFVGDPSYKMMKNSILNFCGVKPVKKNYFGSVKMSCEKQRKIWLEKSYEIGLHE